MNSTDTIAASVSLRVRRIIADHLGYRLDEVTPEKHLAADFRADSLDKVEMLIAVEDEFEISIDDAEDDDIVTVQHLIDVVLKSRKN